ncbi:restriction endonuclease subunit S [Chryseobacterium schmidteae]|uniref:restriction endonuclease subunit S n=1 Tax=Chryseobacterium schmidteae TaxID=2730404 RepID=UPI00158B130C|nr:restriction endonuclease subunit S [Chryseobacterium schmidteae]
MNNDRIQLVPDLRFPEFVSDGDWEEKNLKDVATYENGKAHEQGIDENGKFVVVNSKFISSDATIRKFSNTANCLAKSEETLMVLSDLPNGKALGKCFYVDKDDFYTVNQRICKITPTKIDSKILFYLLNRNPYFLSFDDGVKQTNLRNEDVLNFELLLPSKLKEQQKIASCLSSLDQLITAQKEKLELLKNHKKGLMQNLFPQEGETVPKFRFPEFENDRDWEEKTIGDFIESHKGGASLTPSDFVTQSTFEVIPKKAITAGGWLKLDDLNPTFCSELFFSNNHQSVIDSSYLVTTLRDLVPSGPSIGYIVQYTGKKKMILAQGVYGLKVKKEIVPEFLVQYSNTTHYRKLINAAMVGSTQVHIRNGEFFKIPIKVSLVDEQRKITSCLCSLDDLISTQTAKIEKLQLHKKGLMQGLFPKIID